MMLLPFLTMLIAPTADGSPSYERDVRPILARKCLACHQAKKVAKPELSGGLALDTFEATMRGAADHAVVSPGKAATSPLFARLSDPDDDKRMPLLDEPLAAADRDLIRRWIDGGAVRGERAGAGSTLEPIKTSRPASGRDVSIAISRVDGKPDALLVKSGPLPPVTAMAFAPGGNLLAVGTDGRVVVWDLVERRPAASLDAPGGIHALAFSRDGRRLAVGSGHPARSGSVRVWSVPDGTLLLDLAGHADAVYAVAFRPDGAQLASAGFDATVRLWNLADGSPAGVFAGHSDFVNALAYARDGRTLLSASKDRSIKRIDAARGEGLRTYSGHEQEVIALAARPDDAGFVSAGDEPAIRWWRDDAEKPALVRGGHSGPVMALAFSGDGKRLISASGDTTVRLWDGASGLPLRTLSGSTEWQYAAALSRDGRTAAAGGWDGLARVWDAETGKLALTLVQPPGGWLAITPGGAVVGSDATLARVRRQSGESIR